MTRLARSWRVWVPALGGAAALAAILVSVVLFGADRGTSLTATPYSDVIRFEAAGAGSLEIRVFDLSGKELWSSGIVPDDVIDWDRTNTWGERLAYGAYLYSAQAWDGQGGLLLDRTGKLALLPGDKVQLETAPVASAVSGEFLPSERDGPVYGPLAYNHTGDFTISGSLGVGTDTPSCKIDVRDNADVARLNLTGTEGSLGSADLRFYDTVAGLLGRVYASAKNKYIGFIGLGDSSFRVFTRNTANTQSVERLRITGAADTATAAFLNSNVGIGTTSPGQKLTVAGQIYSTSGGFRFPDGTVQTTAASGGGGGGWSLTGNSGTNPTTNFLGTTDNVAFEVRVNSLRALRIEPNGTSPNVIGGAPANAVTAGVYGATISGGGDSGYANLVTDYYGAVGGGHGNTAGDNAGTKGDAGFATVGGGAANTASGEYATVGGGLVNAASGSRATVGGGFSNIASGTLATVSGGYANTASYYGATVGGGYENAASGDYATVGGGISNTAGAFWATVGGGLENAASSNYATVGGGYENTASYYGATVGGGRANTASGFCATVGGGWLCTAAGDYSFVAGCCASDGNVAHDGVFLFADSTNAYFDSAAANEFAVRASGGYRLYSNAGLTSGVTLAAGGNSWGAVSDRNVKANFTKVDAVQLLDVLEEMPVLTWNLQAQPDEVRHIGPVAQDFNASFAYLFGKVESPVHINMMDAVGISLAAVQGLNTLVQEQAAQIAQQASEIEDLRTRLGALERLVRGGE